MDTQSEPYTDVEPDEDASGSCELCGWAAGDGHNWEAHTAEWKAADSRERDWFDNPYGSLPGEDDGPDIW